MATRHCKSCVRNLPSVLLLKFTSNLDQTISNAICFFVGYFLRYKNKLLQLITNTNQYLRHKQYLSIFRFSRCRFDPSKYICFFIFQRKPDTFSFVYNDRSLWSCLLNFIRNKFQYLFLSLTYNHTHTHIFIGFYPFKRRILCTRIR